MHSGDARSVRASPPGRSRARAGAHAP